MPINQNNTSGAVENTGSSFKDTVVIITGAASGIGLAVAKDLVNCGANVALFDMNEELLQKEFSSDKNTVIYPIDVTDELLVDTTAKTIAGQYGKIDVLINCAGITGKTAVLSHEVETADLEKVFRVNFFGAYFTSKAVIPIMLKNHYGRILHIASIAGKEGNAGMLAYSASKAAVIGMAKVQGKEYAGTGITVNALAPAVIRTPLVDAMPEKQVKYMTDKIPMQRCGTLQEAVTLIKYIVSKNNSFTTGFTFDLSGGRATY